MKDGDRWLARLGDQAASLPYGRDDSLPKFAFICVHLRFALASVNLTVQACGTG
jgi:hypothetical protein